MHWSKWHCHCFDEEMPILLAFLLWRKSIRLSRILGHIKSLGHNGFQAVFYHSQSQILVQYRPIFLLSHPKDCFRNKTVPIELICTVITLIPKIDRPESINKFRPMGICNVSYKVISKIIVSRIRPHLNTIISPFQSSFIPSRQTTDNIIIFQEIIYSLRNCKGKRMA